MTMHFYDERRKDDPHYLPTLEVWQVNTAALSEATPEEGWWYQFVLPGCLNDTEPMGPFESEEEALEHARLPLEEEYHDPYTVGDC